MKVRTKQLQGRYSTRVTLGNVELGFVEDLRYLGHVMTADCRDDKDIKKQFRRQNEVGNMLFRKFLFAPTETKIQLVNCCVAAVLFVRVVSRLAGDRPMSPLFQWVHRPCYQLPNDFRNTSIV